MSVQTWEDQKALITPQRIEKWIKDGKKGKADLVAVVSMAFLLEAAMNMNAVLEKYLNDSRKDGS